LPRPTVASGVPEPKRGKIESAHVSLDRTHRIVRGHVILDPRRKKTSLLSGLSNLEDAIRHATNRTSIRPVAKNSCPASHANPPVRRRERFRVMPRESGASSTPRLLDS